MICVFPCILCLCCYLYIYIHCRVSYQLGIILSLEFMPPTSFSYLGEEDEDEDDDKTTENFRVTSMRREGKTSIDYCRRNSFLGMNWGILARISLTGKFFRGWGPNPSMYSFFYIKLNYINWVDLTLELKTYELSNLMNFQKIYKINKICRRALMYLWIFN